MEKAFNKMKGQLPKCMKTLCQGEWSVQVKKSSANSLITAAIKRKSKDLSPSVSFFQYSSYNAQALELQSLPCYTNNLTVTGQLFLEDMWNEIKLSPQMIYEIP